MAQRYCQRGLEMENDNIEVLELTGHVMMEVGNMEAAKQVRVGNRMCFILKVYSPMAKFFLFQKIN